MAQLVTIVMCNKYIHSHSYFMFLCAMDSCNVQSLLAWPYKSYWSDLFDEAQLLCSQDKVNSHTYRHAFVCFKTVLNLDRV